MHILRQEAEARIQAELSAIEAKGRELTAWEADCFRVALTMFAMHDHSDALAAMRAIHVYRSGRQTEITVRDFQRGLALVSRALPPTALQ